MEIQDRYYRALQFAAAKHKGKTLRGGDLPYLVHVCGVAAEVLIASEHTPMFDLNYAIEVALLHDTIEDTNTSYEEVSTTFGSKVADGVLALTKFDNLPKDEQIDDSLTRIQKLEKEIWAVKLADRITNLQPPPKDWDHHKRVEYLETSRNILNRLRDGNEFLANRLEKKIEGYARFIETINNS